jgi:quinoprotein glucose dehydrogenase
MASHAKTVQFRREFPKRHYAQAARTVLAICGALLSLVGAVMAIAGSVSPLGSGFFLLAGSGLFISGALIARRHRAGAWTFLADFAGTLTWSLRNLEVGGSSLSERLIGPALLLVIFTLLLPVLCQWRPRQAVTLFAALMTGTIAVGVSASPGGPLARPTVTINQFLDTHTDGILK